MGKVTQGFTMHTFFNFIVLRKFLLIVIGHFAEFTLLLEAFLGLESRFFSAFVIWKLKQFRLRGAEYTKSCFPRLFFLAHFMES